MCVVRGLWCLCGMLGLLLQIVDEYKPEEAAVAATIQFKIKVCEILCKPAKIKL